MAVVIETFSCDFAEILALKEPSSGLKTPERERERERERGREGGREGEGEGEREREREV